MTTINRPVPFDGSTAQRVANRATHLWVLDLDGEIRCSVCDHKPWHVGADYPCGELVPREEVPHG